MLKKQNRQKPHATTTPPPQKKPSIKNDNDSSFNPILS